MGFLWGYLCPLEPRKLRSYNVLAQRVKHLPTMQETWVRSLGWEDPLEKEMATHSNILAWRILWMEEPGRLQSTGSQSRTQLSDFTLHFTQCFSLKLSLKGYR